MAKKNSCHSQNQSDDEQQSQYGDDEQESPLSDSDSCSSYDPESGGDESSDDQYGTAPLDESDDAGSESSEADVSSDEASSKRRRIVGQNSRSTNRNMIEHSKRYSCEIPQALSEYFEAHVFKGRRIPFECVKGDIFKTLRNAFEHKEITCNGDLSTFIFNMHETMAPIATTTKEIVDSRTRDVDMYISRRQLYETQKLRGPVKTGPPDVAKSVLSNAESLGRALNPNWYKMIKECKQLQIGEWMGCYILRLVAEFYETSTRVRDLNESLARYDSSIARARRLFGEQ